MTRGSKDNRTLAVAIQAALAGGEVLKRFAKRRRSLRAWRKGPSDWVTQVDHASEEVIFKVIRRAFPDHAIRSEESTPFSQAGADVDGEWMVDPLDGTSNYMHGFPFYTVSVAFGRKGSCEVGAIYDPLHEELFTAQRGKGAWLNGRRIRVSRVRKMEQAFLATGFPFRARSHLESYLESFRQIFSKTGLIRRAGSAALDLAYTACGRLDGFWELSLAPWDMAAGTLLICEAGGSVSDFYGKETYLQTGHVAAGNRSIHTALVKILAPIFRGRILSVPWGSKTSSYWDRGVPD